MDADGHDKTREFPTANGIAVLGYAGTIAHVEAAVHTIEQSMNKADSPYAAKTVCEKGIDAARELCEAPEVEFVLGVRCGRTVDLFSVVFDAGKGIGTRSLRYAVAGSGGYVAEYILKRAWPPNHELTREQAERLAQYTVDEVVWAKVRGCGGATWLRVLTDEADSPVDFPVVSRDPSLLADMTVHLGAARRSLHRAILGA